VRPLNGNSDDGCAEEWSVVAIRAWLVSHSVCPCSARKPDVYATKAQARSDVILYIDGFNNMGAGTQPRATAGPMETLWLSTARPDGVEEDTIPPSEISAAAQIRLVEFEFVLAFPLTEETE
jgi:hypothetical protein